MALLPPKARAHRNDLAELVQVAHRDLSILFRRFDSPTDARDGLLDVLPKLSTIYGEAAATLGADYYDDMREAAGVRKRFTAIVADTAPKGQTDALARWAVSPLFQAEPDYPTTLAKVSGGLQRLIVNADRETVRVSSIEDSQAQGWMRVGSGECEWCEQYLDGEIHYIEGYDFQAHDHCQCTADPAF